MTPAQSRSAAFTLALLVPAALLAGAYTSQYGFGLVPCEMCWWQRYPHFAAVVLSALALVMRRQPAGMLLVRLAALAILISGLIGLYHAGVEYHWWEGFTTCTTVQLGGNALDAILNAPLIRCDQAQWTLFGISLAGYNFLISTGAAVLIFALLRKGAKA
ncbi:MAG: hypothetical protein RIS94_1835 [Pseudomonadota bacterium]|jgi:disulfide bond formation protein DsbB